MSYYDEEYMNGYKLGKELGMYEAIYKLNVEMFDDVFDDNYKVKRNRIKYLANIEQLKLIKLLNSASKYAENKELNNDEKLKLENKKEEILNLLR